MVLFDAKVSKDNPLYGLISTDFHGEDKKEDSIPEDKDDKIILYPIEDEEIPEEKAPVSRKKNRGEIRRRRLAERRKEHAEKEAEEILIEPEKDSMPERQVEEHPDRASQIILQMASYQDVSMKDILCILEDLPESEVEEKINDLISEGSLITVEGHSGLRYRKGS